MTEKHSTPKLIVIVGPTAVGKTALSIEIAKDLQTEIISADSRQFYKDLIIGTASPTDKELQTVKHHFIGTLSINEYYSAYKYREDVLTLLSDIFNYNKYVVLTGGSGLYINAVTDGIDQIPDPDERIRKDVIHLFETQGIEALRNHLKILDPDYYNKVDLANPKRLMRALEICIQTGNTYTSLRIKKTIPTDHQVIKIGLNLNRDMLYNRINQRVDQMIKSGLLEEAKNLYPYKTLNALNTVGYKELFDYMDNKYSLETAIEKIKQNSRRYAKKQLTWFNKDQDIKWFKPDEKENILYYIKSVN